MPPIETNIAPWLLRSKVTPPRQLMSVIARPDLINRLENGAEGNLIILEAPGGYGKSCLLSEWRDQSIQGGATLCWLSIDEDDDVETFIAYLAYSAHIAGIDMAQSGLLSFEFSTDRNPKQAIHQLLARIERTGRPVRIVLDDFERLSPAVQKDVIPALLGRLPENATIIVASREPVCISTVDLDHRGLVARLGPDELRFGYQDMMRLWKGRLTQRQIERLGERTEGWPVLIRLLLTASDMGTFDIRHIDEASYRDMAITTYFEQKILSRIDSDLRRFLIDASIFDEIPYEAISDVLGQSTEHFAERLEKLEAFLAPLSGENAGYRLHPMMREYMRQSLQERSPERYKALQIKAAHWYSAKENHVRAVKHALAAGDEPLLLTILENTGGLGLWVQEGLIEFRSIDRHLSQDIIQQSPTAALMRCIILMKTGKQSDAASLYANILSRHAERIASDSFLSVSCAVAKVVLAVYSGAKIDDQDVERIEQAISQSDAILRHFEGFVLTFKCFAAHQAGRLKDAIEFGQDALEVFERSGSLYGEVYIHLHLAMIHSFMRSTDRSDSEFKRASDLIRRELSFDSGIKYLSDVISIEAYHEHSPYDLKNVPRLKNLVARLLRAEGWIDIYAGAFRTLSEQIYLAGNIDDAFHVLDLAQEFSKRNSIDSLSRICVAQRVILSLLEFGAEGVDPAEWIPFGETIDPLGDLASFPWRIVEVECELHLHLANAGLVKPSLDQVTAFRDAQLAEGNLRIAARMSALLALARPISHVEADLSILDRCLERDCFGRALLFIGPALQLHVDSAGLQMKFPHLMAQLSASQAGKKAKTGRGQESIVTDKERAVLNELRKGQTDKQIALCIGVTEHAIRYHLKNVYVKLNARSRQEAVRRARALGVLDA
jgi:LuxR family transcriptional regulator, maltose regulon positive regulatory protein